MKIFEVVSSQPKNDELLEYFKTDSTIVEIWPLFIGYMVYKTDGEGILELEEVSGMDLAEEEFDDEYEKAIKLSSKLFHKISHETISKFKEECKNELEELKQVSNTSSSFDLLNQKLLPDDTVLIHYTDAPEKVFNEGFR